MEHKIGKPCVLAIGGLDPGAGAGILADARAIGRAGAFACAAIAVTTVQSTGGLRSATPLASRGLVAAAREVLRVQRVRAFKIGALGSVENARAVGRLLAQHPDVPAVVDTVMLPTRGRGRLLATRAIGTLRDQVIGRATLATVNGPEAEALTGYPVRRLADAERAARSLLDAGARAVLVKGGHLDDREAIDLLAWSGPDSRVSLRELRAPRLPLPPTHGGGCVLASLIAGRLALRRDAFALEALSSTVRWAKRVHHQALAAAVDVGGPARVLGWSARTRA